MNIGNIYVGTKVDRTGLERDLKKTERSVKNSATRISKMWSTVGPAVAAGAIAGGYAIQKLAREVISLGREFEASMKTVQAWSGASGKELQDLTNIAKKMGATTEWTAKQSAEALQYLAAAGFTAKQSIAALPGALNLATAGQVDLATATDITTDTLTAFGLSVAELKRINDAFIVTTSNSNTNIMMLGQSFKMVAPTAKLFGVSVEETAAMLGVLANAGVKAEMAGSGLNMAFLKSARAAKMLNLDGMTPLIDVLRKMKEEQWNALKIGEAFGARQVKTIGILMEGIGAYESLTEKINENAGATQKLADIIRDSVDVDIKTLNSAIQDVLLETFDALKDDLREIIQLMTQWVRENKEGVVKSIIAIADALKVAMKPLQMWADLWQRIGFKAGGGSKVRGMDYKIPGVDKALKDFFKDMESAPKSIDKATTATKKLNKTLKDTTKELNEIAKLEKQVFDDMVDNAIQADRELADAHEAYYEYELDQIRNRTKATEEANRKALESYEHFYEEVEDTASDTFYRILDGQLDSWKDLLDEMKSLFLRVFADMAAAALAKPIIVPIVASVVGSMGLGGLLGGAGGLLGGGGGIGGLSNLAGLGGLGGFLGSPIIPGHTAMSASAYGIPTWGSALGSAGLGYLGYSTIGGMLGVPQGGYSGIGSALGGGIGSIFGPIGTVAGSGLGGWIGSMFGGKAHKPHIGFSAGISYGAEGFAPIAGYANQPHRGPEGYSVGKLRGSGNINEARNALDAQVSAMLDSYTANLNSIIAQIPDLSADMLSKFDFDFTANAHTSNVEGFIDNAMASFNKAIEKHYKQVMDVLEPYYHEALREALILQIGGAEAPIELQLKAINQQYDAYREQLEALSATTSELTWLEEQRNRALDQATGVMENSISAWEGIAQSIQDQIYSLKTGGLSPLSLTEQMGLTRASIAGIYGGGELTPGDVGQLQGLYADLLGIGKELYSPVDTGQIWRSPSIIEGQYETLFGETIGALEGLAGYANAEIETDVHLHLYIDSEEIGYTVAKQSKTNPELIAALQAFAASPV